MPLRHSFRFMLPLLFALAIHAMADDAKKPEEEAPAAELVKETITT